MRLTTKSIFTEVHSLCTMRISFPEPEKIMDELPTYHGRYKRGSLSIEMNMRTADVPEWRVTYRGQEIPSRVISAASENLILDWDLPTSQAR